MNALLSFVKTKSRPINRNVDSKRTLEQLHQRAAYCRKFLMLQSGEKHEEMRATLEQAQENQWLALRNTLNEHLKNTAERRRAVAELTTIDRAGSAIVKKQREMTEKAYHSIQKLNRSLAAIENAPPTAALTERNTLRAALNSLRARMDRGNALDNCQMVHLVITSNAVLQVRLKNGWVSAFIDIQT